MPVVLPGSALADPQGYSQGCLPRVQAYGERKCFLPAEAEPLIPASEWQEVSMRNLFWHTHDQDGVSSCTCNAAAAIVEALRELQGLPRRILSPGNLYNRICGGVDRGSSLDDALEELINNGIATAEVQPVNDWRTMPANWKNSAKHYKILEWVDLNGSIPALFSSIQRRRPVLIGVMWPGGGGHAIVAMGSRKDAKGAWEAEIKNSWGAKWGIDGFGYLTQATLRTMPTFGCWAGRVATSSQGA